MARQKSEFLSVIGKLFELFKLVVDDLLSRGGGDAQIEKLRNPKIRAQIVDILMATGKPIEQLADNCYEVIVDYGQTLQQMVANGRYDYVNGDIKAGNFPIRGSGKQNAVIELVHFGRDMASEAVLNEFEARGLRAATLPELLAFGATYPEKQREFPIVALGSVWRIRRGSRCVPCLLRFGSGRELNLSWGGSGWSGDCRFAAVRK